MRIRYFQSLLLALSVVACTTGDDAPDTMRAVVVSNGTPDLQIVPVPEPREGEVLVRVRAVGVNPIDEKSAQRNATDGGESYIPGYDAAGTVEAVGDAVTSLEVGDEVIVWSRLGTYAEYVAVPENTVVRKPAAMSFEHAGAIPHASITAWSMVVDVADVQPGQRVVVIGGSGGVGSSAVQIAKARGAYVYAIASTRNQDYLRALGADEPIDYRTTNFREVITDADVVINTVDLENAYNGLKVLKRGGALVSVGGLPTDEECAAVGVTCASRTTSAHGDVLHQLVKLFNEDKFSINIDKRFALAEYKDAWDYSATGRTRGKSVIVVIPE